MYKVVYCSTVCNSEGLETPSMSINRDRLYYDARIQGNNIQCEKKNEELIENDLQDKTLRGEKSKVQYKLYATPCVKDGGKE